MKFEQGFKKMNIKRKQKESLGKLWRIFSFNKSLIARELGVSNQVVNNWFSRGRISATMAIKASEHPKVSGLILKEDFRPDIKEWFGV